jgi:hypothetical protein
VDVQSRPGGGCAVAITLPQSLQRRPVEQAAALAA